MFSEGIEKPINLYKLLSINLLFSNVFRGYRKRPVAWNALIPRIPLRVFHKIFETLKVPYKFQPSFPSNANILRETGDELAAISENYIEIKINVYVDFLTSSWCLKVPHIMLCKSFCLKIHFVMFLANLIFVVSHLNPSKVLTSL